MHADEARKLVDQYSLESILKEIFNQIVAKAAIGYRGIVINRSSYNLDINNRAQNVANRLTKEGYQVRWTLENNLEISW